MLMPLHASNAAHFTLSPHFVVTYHNWRCQRLRFRCQPHCRSVWTVPATRLLAGFTEAKTLVFVVVGANCFRLSKMEYESQFALRAVHLYSLL